MAANYWTSTQRQHWLFTKEKLSEILQNLEKAAPNLVQQYALPDRRLLSLYFQQLLTKLGRRLNVRQQALATAQVYVRRFYIKVEIRRTNPHLVIATALYLACKMEECPQHIRVIVSEARSLWPDCVAADVSKIGECEFWLISEMQSQMIIHHPYRTLPDLQKHLSLVPDENSLAWSIINDHYLTDAPLLYPPHLIAVTAVFLAVVLKPAQGGLQASAAVASALAALPQSKDGPGLGKDIIPASGAQEKVQFFVRWLADGEIDIVAMTACIQDIISLYEIIEQFSDKTCKEQISRFVKAQGLDK